MTLHKKKFPHSGAKNEPSPQEVNTLVALFKQGRYAEIESLARTMTERFPLHGFGWKAMGTVLLQQGRTAEALAPLQEAARLAQGDAQLHNNLGNALTKLGKLPEAEASYRQAFKLNPDFIEAHYNLGNVLQKLDQLPESVASYRRALELKPDFAEAHNSLGNTLLKLGRLSEAEASYRRAIKIKPDFAEAQFNLGEALSAQNRLPEARVGYQRALELKPDYAEAHLILGNISGDISEAETSYRRALEIKPDLAEAHNNLGIILRNKGQLDAAVDSYRKALVIIPDYAEAHSNLGNTLKDFGQLDNAIASFRRALEIKPDFAEAYSNLLFCLTHNPAVDAKTIFSEHCQFSEKFETPFLANCPQHANSPDPNRILQIGFVSGDFRNHAVSHFLEPLLVHLSNYPQLSLHAYSNNTVEDAVTQRIRGYFMHWNPVAGLSDTDLAKKIRADSIDILIDLSGHTAKNRLLTFARKPAPVQASWLGYLGTTGLRSMDYYLADRFFLPHDKFKEQFTEKIVHLPAVAPFMSSKDAPQVNALPAMSNGFMTFGSFNRLNKLTLPAIALWSRLLRALPESRLVLGAMPQDGYNTLTDWLVQEGIAQERLSFHPKCSLEAYLALHQQVDICLDAFPYSGGTTTNHALWMGVPTLTLPGGTPSSRVAATYLSHVGLEGFIAQDTGDYVNKGLGWAQDIEALARVRADLRGRFEQSALGQPALIAECLERALRIMWQRWCEHLPPVVFDVGEKQTNCAMREDDK